MKWAGLTAPRFMGRTGEIYCTEEEHRIVKNHLLPHEDKFIVVWCLRGTMQQKAVQPLAKQMCDVFLNAYPNSYIILTGDETCQEWEWDHPSVKRVSGVWPFREAALACRYADLVVTPETGLGVVAGAYGRPKIMMLTAASIQNICGNDKNDYSLQSEAYCSPCTRAIYDTRSCPCGADGRPICVNFGVERVVSRMEEVVRAKIPRNWGEGEKYTVNGETVWM